MNYIDHDGVLYTEQGTQDRLLSVLYTSRWGRCAVKLLAQPPVSELAGKLLDTGVSRFLVGPFIRLNHMDMEPYVRTQPGEFTSYNDFFTREIQKEKRPVDQNANHLIAPCDARVSVYPIDGDRSFTVKHTRYTLRSLLHSRELARRYRGGYAIILRLCVTDYHRYIYPVTGVKSDNYRIPGIFHTVNPIAVERADAFKENTREFTLIRNREFGTILQMEVGALMVGRICNYHQAGEVRRGEEKGRFEFGGSTVILLIEPGRARIREDLLRNTGDGCETQVWMGEAIGSVSSGYPNREIRWRCAGKGKRTWKRRRQMKGANGYGTRQ